MPSNSTLKLYPSRASAEDGFSLGGSRGGIGSLTADLTNNLYEVFGPIDPEEVTGSESFYACVFLHNTSNSEAVDDVYIWFDYTSAPSPTGQIALGVGDTNVTSTESLSSRHTAPSGVTFSEPIGETNEELVVATLEPQKSAAIWLRISPPAGPQSNTYRLRLRWRFDTTSTVQLQDLDGQLERTHDFEPTFGLIEDKPVDKWQDTQGFVLGTRTQPNHASVGPGRIIASDPEGGSFIASGSTVDWEVSAGPVGGFTLSGSLDQYNVAGDPEINGFGFDLSYKWKDILLVRGSRTTSSHATIPSGSIISHTGDDGTTALTPGTSIDWVVSTGP